MARRMGKRSQLAGRGTYHTAFSWYCSTGSADARISKGEIDIVEGVNDQGSDLVSLHTSPGKHFRFARRAFSRLTDTAQIAPCRDHVRWLGERSFRHLAPRYCDVNQTPQ